MSKITISPDRMTLKSGHVITKSETQYGNVFTMRNENRFLIFETAAYGCDSEKIEECKRVARA